MIVGTVTAFVQSYEGLYSWARRYLDEGWARTWPIQVDAWIAVGELALYLGYRDRWPVRRRIWPWLAALTGLAASTGFNVGHLAGADLAGQLTAAVPPVAAFGGLFLGLQVLKYVEEDREHQTPDRHHVSLAAAIRIAGLVTAADRLAAARTKGTSNGQRGRSADGQLVNGAHRQARLAGSQRSRRGRRIPAAIESEAASIVRAEPDIRALTSPAELVLPSVPADVF